MTYEEAAKAIQVDGVVHATEESTCIEMSHSKMMEFYTGLRVAEEALEKADRYKWHDLLKNPDDLPAVNTDWIICVKEKNENCIYAITDKMIIGNNLYDAQDVDITVLKRGIGKMYGDVFVYANKVISWRYEEVKA